MKRFSKNVIALLLSDVVKRLAGFLAVAYLARRVGVEGFGIINIAFTVLSYTLLISSMGLGSYGTREIARGSNSGIINVVTSIRFTFSVVVYLIVFILTQVFIHNEITIELIRVLSLSIFASAFFLDWYYQGKERMIVVSSIRIVSAIIYLIIILIFVKSKLDIIWIGIAALIADSASCIALLILYRRSEGDLRVNFDLPKWKEVIKRSYPLGAGAIFTNLSINLAPLIIGIILTNTNVGIFSAASKLVFFLLMLDRIFGSLLFPASARFFTDSVEKLSDMLNTATKWIVFVSLPLSVGGTMLANKIIVLVFGSQYQQAIVVFQILIWYFLITMLHTIYTSGLIAVGKEKSYSKIMMLGFFVYFISIVVLTKLYGEVGTAVAMVLSELVTLVLLQIQLKMFINIGLSSYFLKTIPATIVMGLCLFILPNYHVLILVIIGIIVYVITALITKVITNQDIDAMLKRL